MRILMFVVAVCGVLAASMQILADQPADQPATIPAPVTPVVQLEQLVDLGKAVAAIRYESDNTFIYAERSEELYRSARELTGGQIECLATVMRVNSAEVRIEVAPAGKTRLVLMHATAPQFGNLLTVRYPGPASTRRLHMFSAPVGLRIGSEIDFEIAKKLRRRDTLVIRGTIECLPVWIDSVFAPDAVALISNWSVVEVNPQPKY